MHSVTPSCVDICLFQPRQHNVMQNWLQANWLRVAPNVSRYEPAGLWYLIAMVEKYHELELRLRWLTSWKLSSRPSRKSCDKETSIRQLRTSPNPWLPTWFWLPLVVTLLTLSTCSNSIRHFPKFAYSSHHQQFGSLQSHQQTSGEDNARNAEHGGCLP